MSGSVVATLGAGPAQPAIHAAQTTAASAPIEHNRGGCNRATEDDVGWVFLEIGLALAIAIAIVWWTLPKKPKAPEEKDER